MRLASLAPWTLTERRVRALEILSAEGPLPLRAFSRSMWHGKVDAAEFARYFLSFLLKAGLVERSGGKGKDDEIYRLSEEGTRLLEAPPWECPYCEDSIWPARSGATLVRTDCGACGQEHRPCHRCAKKLTIAVGEFPHYRMALRECPKARREA